MSSSNPDPTLPAPEGASSSPERYMWIQTADGSPSLSHGAGESMHSRAGAFSETRYIYLPVVEEALKEAAPLRLLVVGLGLGYIEIMAAGAILNKEKFQSSRTSPDNPIVLVSCESDEQLRTLFSDWILNKPIDPEFSDAYDWILKQTAESFDLTPNEIHARLRDWCMDGRLVLYGALEEPFPWKEPFSGICFDAYSSKTSPDLWDENFLVRFYSQLAGPFCTTATYACTGALKRALTRTGFQVNTIPGFSGKRQSTFARKTIPSE